MSQKKKKDDDQWETVYPVEFKWIGDDVYVRRSDVDNEDWKQIDPGELRGERSNMADRKLFKATTV